MNPARGIKLLNGINRFNRYMVECECYHKRYGYIGIGVLIDTWWNVNLSRKQSLTVNPLVLIDTWWNVNVVSAGCVIFKKLVLIDTWWNVNFW